jgi:MFS family permease
MQSTAQQWLVYRLTDSQLSLGTVTFASFFPVLLLSLFMGVLVDRFQTRRLLVLTQSWFMLLAAVLALLTYAEAIQYWQILLLSVLLGIGTSLDMPARQAFYIDLVDREDLLNAVALNSSIFNGARIIGPTIGGLIVASLGEAPAFAINSITFIAVIAALLVMRLPPFDAPITEEAGLEKLKEGLTYLVTNRRVLGLVSMIALFSVFSFPHLVILPAYARDVLSIGVDGFGILMAAPGIGALIGALSLAAYGERRHKGRLLLYSQGLLAIALTGLSFSRSPIISMVALAIAGYAIITILAVTNTTIQMMTPDALRGRVISAFTWALGGFWPIGSVLIGALGDHFGAPRAVLLAAVSAGILTIAGRLWFPDQSTVN